MFNALENEIRTHKKSPRMRFGEEYRANLARRAKWSRNKNALRIRAEQSMGYMKICIIKIPYPPNKNMLSVVMLVRIVQKISGNGNSWSQLQRSAKPTGPVVQSRVRP